MQYSFYKKSQAKSFFFFFFFIIGLYTAEAHAKELVILVHGLGRKNYSMQKIATYIEKESDSLLETFSPGYPSREGNIDYQIRILKSQIEPYLEDSSYTTCHIVGHSLGGILGKILWSDLPKEKQGALVMLGAPIAGSPWLDKGFIQNEILDPFFGPITEDLSNVSDIWLKYAINLEKNHKTLKVAGNSCPWHMNWLGGLYGVKEPHDCFVTQRSALAYGAEQILIVPLDHDQLLKEPDLLCHIYQWIIKHRNTPSA